MLIEASFALVKEPRSSVRGTKLTADADAAALFDLHTPPAFVPKYTRFPVESLGSMAMEVIRPVSRP
jgi:hypothetical protein